MAPKPKSQIAKIDIDVENRTIYLYDSNNAELPYDEFGTSLPRYAKSSPAGLLIQALVKMLDGRVKEYT